MAGTDGEGAATRLARLRMRSIRRGIREMDLILGAFAADGLAALDAPGLDAYEALLEESDHDLLLWVTGAAPAPEAHAALVARLRDRALAVAEGLARDR